MNAKTLELILKILAVAGPLVVQVPALGKKWIANRNEVLKMVEEGRDPTPEEHARLTRELDSLIGSFDAAVASAEAAVAAAAAEADATEE